MFNKLYETLKKYIKENYKTLIIILTIYIILSIPVPYYIYNGGGTIDISKRIKINNKESDQNFHMCYVGQMKSNLLTLFISYVFPNIDNEKIEDDNYDADDEHIINDLLLKESRTNSIINALNQANKNISINSEELYISHVYEEAETDFEIGDQIISIDDAKINTFDDFKSLIENLEFSSKINIIVKDYKGKKQKRTAKIIDIEGEKKIGVGITINYGYKSEENINIKFKGNETGPSGGLMMSLSIYDNLTESNLSDNNKICGTGTISKDGEVGEIGGVKYKLNGAVKDGCDIFLVPNGDNYNEAIKEKKKNKYNIEIYGVKTFSDALLYLQKL